MTYGNNEKTFVEYNGNSVITYNDNWLRNQRLFFLCCSFYVQ